MNFEVFDREDGFSTNLEIGLKFLTEEIGSWRHEPRQSLNELEQG